MNCLHPFCPLGNGVASWADLFSHPNVRANAAEQTALSAAFAGVAGIGGLSTVLPPLRAVVKKRLLTQAPCLFMQVAETVTAGGVVHLCEVTLGAPISSSNVETAFAIQDPSNQTLSFLHAPVVPGAKGGDIMEQICSRLLSNEGVPHMEMDAGKWPAWASPSHVSLNAGKYSALKMYGDILIPAAPHNILISVKSVKARERFLVSGNRLESVGFGFFDQASEFRSISRMKLFKRWGFVAIYMPQTTLESVETYLDENDRTDYSININGLPLYRPLSKFTTDMRQVAGRTTLSL